MVVVKKTNEVRVAPLTKSTWPISDRNIGADGQARNWENNLLCLKMWHIRFTKFCPNLS